jgi:hypothetical protein
MCGSPAGKGPDAGTSSTAIFLQPYTSQQAMSSAIDAATWLQLTAIHALTMTQHLYVQCCRMGWVALHKIKHVQQ